MNPHFSAYPLALFLTVSAAHASTNSLFISGNVMTGQTWHAPNNAGDGSSGGCSVTGGLVEYYSVPFFTDQSSGQYNLHLEYPSGQDGFVYLYHDGFDANDPCNGLFAFALAPVVDINHIHLDANRQYFVVTSEAVLYGGTGGFQLTLDGPAGSHLFVGNGAGMPVPFCFGDGFDPNVTVPCPCGSFGLGGHGCNNSVGSGGAQLNASGTLSPDAVVLHVNGTLPSTTTVFFQGSAIVATGVTFGEGIRCVGGSLMRLGVKVASNGSASYPGAGDPSIRTQSEQGGNAIPAGAIRYYQVYYRDPNPAFCPNIPGNTWNVSNGVRITWP
jgi:hypothetical protein